MNDIKVRLKGFSFYGLNKFRNFLKKKILRNVHTFDDLLDFMEREIINHGCMDSAIFALSYDDQMFMAIADFPLSMLLSNDSIEGLLENESISEEDINGDGEPVKFCCSDDFDLEWFAEQDADYKLCCYGLIIETKPGVWEVITD